MINRLYENIKNGETAHESDLFSSLSERFHYFLQYKVTDSEDREDLVQEVLKAIAAKYLTVELEGKFSSWVYGVLEKQLLYYYRTRANQQKKQTAIEETGTGDESVGLDPHLKLSLERCFKKLCGANRRYARILNLSYNGYRIDEVCRRLKMTKNNVYIVLSRGRALLKNCLKTGELK